MESKADLLYSQLIKDGYSNLGTPDEFKTKVKNRDKADLLFKQLIKDGYSNLGSFDEFFSKVAQEEPVKKKEQTISAVAPEDTESKSDTGFLEQPGLNPFGIGKKVRNDFETTLKAVELGVTPLELKNAKKAEVPVEDVPEMGDIERAALSTEPVRYRIKTFEEKTKEFAVDEDKYSANKESIDNIVLPPEALDYLDKNKTVVGSRGLGQSVPIKNVELERKLKAWYALNPEGQKEYEFHKKVLNHGRDVIDKAEEIVNQKIIEATDEWRASMVQEAQYDPTGKNVYKEKPTRLLVLEAEADKIKSARKALDAYKDAKTASTATQVWNQIGRQIGDVATDAASFGLIPMSKNLTFFNLKKKQEEGNPLTDDEKRLLDTAAYAEYIAQTYAGTTTFAQDAVTAIGHSVPYMVSFASLGGLAKMATKGGTGALKSSVQLVARQGLPNAMARVTGAQTSTALQVASKLSGAVGTRGAAVLADAIDNVAKAGIQVMIDPRTYDKTIKNMTGNVGFNITDEGKVTFTGFENDLSFPQALVKAYTSQMVENLSEYSGGLLGTATRPLSRWTSKNIPALSRMINKTKFTGTTKKFMDAAGFHGIVPEFFEEQLATIGHAITGDGEGDWSDLTDPRQQLLTLTTVAAIGSGASMASAGIRKIGKDTAESAFNDAVSELKSQFGEDFVELGKSMTTNSVVVNEESIREILDNPGYSNKQKMAAYNYYVAGNRYYAYKENADERAMTKSEEEQLEERKNEQILENVLTANKGIGYEQAVEIANAEIDLRSLADNNTESGNIAKQNIKKFIQDAIQKSKTKGGLLRYEQSEMGLPEVGERIEEQKPGETGVKTEEVNPAIEELGKRRDDEIAALDDMGFHDTVTHESLTSEDRDYIAETLSKRNELTAQIIETYNSYEGDIPDEVSQKLEQLEAQSDEIRSTLVANVKKGIAAKIKEKYDAQIKEAEGAKPVAAQESTPVVEESTVPAVEAARPTTETTTPVVPIEELPPPPADMIIDGQGGVQRINPEAEKPAPTEFDAPEVRQEVMRSLKLTLPDVDVVMDSDLEVAQQSVKDNLISRGLTPEEADSAVSGMTADSGRVFNVKGKPAIIFLNPALMNDRTLGHEFWHGILAEAFGENQPMFEKFQKAIDKRLRDSGYTAIADKLTAFAEGYEAGQFDFEEYLAEFGGYLTQEGFNVDKLKGREKTLLNQIKQVINKFSKAIFGQEVFMNDATAENILEFMIAASEKMKAGEAVPIKRKKEGGATTTRSQKASQSVSNYEMTPGYLELSKKIDDMISQAPYYQQEGEKGSKAKKLEKHYELMLDMLNTDKAYALMTDTQREELVIGMRKELGLKVTPSPSTMIPKLLGHIENVSSITMDELELLKLKLKSEIRGVINYKDAVVKSGVQLGKDIKELVSNNKITQKQALKILNRFRRTNLLDEVSVEKFLDYTAKVFSDSNYSEFLDQMQRKKEAAMSNLRDKVGNATAFIELATNMLSLKPEIIPRRAMISYVRVMNILGSNKSVLPLDAREQMMDDMHYVMKEVEMAYNTALDLAIRFEEFQDKVYSEKTGDVIFGQTIKKMLAPQVDEDGNITPGVIDQGEYEIMERFRATILEEYYNSGKTNEEYQRATQEQKDAADKQRKEQEANTRKRLIHTIIKSDVDENELANVESRRSAKELIDLIKKRAYLERMSTTDLKILSAVLSNIEDGFYPHSAQKMKERLKSIGKAIDAVDIFERIKMGSLSGIRARVRSKFTKNESAYYHLIISNPMGIIDEALGNFKGREVYNTFIRDMASAYSVYKSEYDDIQTMLDKSLDALAKENKGRINDMVSRQFLMMAYALQREYENNLGNSQVTSPFATIEETIKAAIGDVSYYGAREAKILKDILDKFGDTNNLTLNADAIYSNMTPVEKDMVDNILPKINASLAPKASYTAGVLRDNAIGLLNNYIHHTVLGVGKRANQATIENKALSEVNKFMNSMNASTRSKLLTERDGKVHPIMFNIYAAASASAKSVLLDYHMTEPARVMNRTTHNVLTEMRLRENESHKRQKEGGNPEAEQAVRDKIRQVREIMGAVDTAVEQTLRNTVISALGHETNLERALNEVVKQGVRSMLGSIRRSLMQELGSNMLYLATYADVSKEAMSKHMRDYVYSHTGRYVMENLSAANTQRLYPSGTISGSAIEQTQIGRYYGMKQGRTVNPIVNALMTIHNNSTKKVKNFADTTADLLISTPDKFLSRQIWFGALGIEFKRLTGEKIDMDKVAENNEDYMSLHAEHLQAAKNYADLQSIRASATDNPFLGIIKTTIEPVSKNWATTFMKTFDKFLIRFQIFEFTAARAGVVSAMGNGMLSRAEGLRLLAAVMMRSMGYTTLGILTKQMMTNLIVSMFGLKGDDDESDKNVGQALTQGFATAFTSFVFGRNLGNMWRGSVNYPIELLNQKYFSGIIRGDREYDMFKDPITYSFIPAGDLRGKDAAWETAKSMTAGYSPLVKTISYSANKAIYVFSGRSKDREAYDRAVKDLYIRTPLEVLGLMGYVPMYNDIRKATLDILYDDLKGKNKGPYKSDAEKEYLKSIGK
jgi:hypothetical protein